MSEQTCIDLGPVDVEQLRATSLDAMRAENARLRAVVAAVVDDSPAEGTGIQCEMPPALNALRVEAHRWSETGDIRVAQLVDAARDGMPADIVHTGCGSVEAAIRLRAAALERALLALRPEDVPEEHRRGFERWQKRGR